MPTFTLAKKTRTSGEREFSVAARVIGSYSVVRLDLLFDAADLTNPDTHVEFGIEWSPHNADTWRHLASVGFVGYAGCPTSASPYLAIRTSVLARHLGDDLRFFLYTVNPISVGATITVS